MTDLQNVTTRLSLPGDEGRRGSDAPPGRTGTITVTLDFALMMALLLCVGERTASRRWVKYEPKVSRDRGNGLSWRATCQAKAVIRRPSPRRTKGSRWIAGITTA